MVDQFLPFFVVATRFAGYQDIEIAYGFTSSAQGTSGSDFLDAGIVAQMLDDFAGLSFCSVEEKASGDAAIILDRFQQLLLVLFAHAGQSADLTFLGQFLHALGIADLIGAPD